MPAAREAWRGADVCCDPSRIGVFVGAESGRVSFQTLVQLSRAAGGAERFEHARFAQAAPTFVKDFEAATISAASVASALAAEVDAQGPVQTISLACASGSAAIIEAVRAIRLGVCDVALCGGVGADVDPMMLAGFGLLDALSTSEVSRPFDTARDGFVLGEGAAMFVLSKHAGTSRCELSGIGRSLDGWRLTAPDPKGAGASRAMAAALNDAGLNGVDYVQAHGTSTRLNDAVEAAALRRTLGRALDRAHVSSVKGALGHWIAGAGALGLLCAHEAVVNGRVLPTAGLETPDPDCDLPHVMGQAIHAHVHTAMVNSFAFGGANCSIVIGRSS
jgi:3-oxoacyl-[acyl-carrier-protein] synthase II